METKTIEQLGKRSTLTLVRCEKCKKILAKYENINYFDHNIIDVNSCLHYLCSVFNIKEKDSIENIAKYVIYTKKLVYAWTDRSF